MGCSRGCLPLLGAVVLGLWVASSTAQEVTVTPLSGALLFPYCSCLDYRCQASPYELTYNHNPVTTGIETTMCFTLNWVRWGLLVVVGLHLQLHNHLVKLPSYKHRAFCSRQTCG